VAAAGVYGVDDGGGVLTEAFGGWWVDVQGLMGRGQWAGVDGQSAGACTLQQHAGNSTPEAAAPTPAECAPAVNTTTSANRASSARNSLRPGRSTTKTPAGLRLEPAPTRCVTIEAGRRGARLGVKLEMSVPSRSSSTVRRPCGLGQLALISIRIEK